MSDFKKFKNKQKSGCLAGEDKDFINKYLTPLEGYGHLPLSIENHPVCKDSTNDFKKDS
jgi:hypothetical protein